MTGTAARVEAYLTDVLGPPETMTTARDLAGHATPPCAIATFAEQPVDGAFTLVTVGLSETPLTAPNGERLRQELLLTGWDDARSESAYEALLSVALTLAERGESADPGALLDLGRPLAPEGGLHLVFLYDPTYHPEALTEVPPGDGLDADAVEVVWLIPVTEAEASLIETEGPEAFERYLAATDPDLLDLRRSDPA